jgi:hypothetical protein
VDRTHQKPFHVGTTVDVTLQVFNVDISPLQPQQFEAPTAPLLHARKCLPYWTSFALHCVAGTQKIFLASVHVRYVQLEMIHYWSGYLAVALHELQASTL